MPLLSNEIQILCSDISRPLESPEDSAGLLDESEKERYRRFRFDADRLRFLHGRSILKKHASRLLEADPNEMMISFNPHGKPLFSNQPLKFSITHSGNVTAVAFSHTTEIGLDSECIREIDDISGLSLRFFSDAENQYLSGLSDKEVLKENFFRVWSAKEAYVKAAGTGLSTVLSDFSVVDSNGHFRLMMNNNIQPSAVLHELSLGEGHRSFLCALDPPEELQISIEQITL